MSKQQFGCGCKITWQIYVGSIETSPYPEIGYGNFKGALWTFTQWLALEMRVRYEISFVPLTSSCKAISGYGKKSWKLYFSLK